MKKFTFITLFFILITKSFALDFWSNKEKETLINEIISQMNDSELLGQIFMISYEGSEIDEYTLNFIKDKNLGGIKIFGWNAKDLYSLVESIKKAQQTSHNNKFKIPLFVATDQEGGWTQHIRLTTSETIGNLGITATLSPIDSYYTGYYIGDELRRLGINLNFAPIVDLYTNEENFAVGPRSYSDDPKIVSLFSLAFYKGQEKSGVISTAKHFPGHGNTNLDSHGILPIINSDITEIYSNELLPYKSLIYEDIPVIMTGHIAYPELTNGEKIPASSSKKIIKGILRDKLNYENLIITDDLIMNGARYKNENIYTTIERIVRTGTDILLISLNKGLHENAYNRLLSLMKTDKEIKNNITQSNKRILKIKLKYLKEIKNKVKIYPEINEAMEIPTKEAKEFFKQTTLRGITKIKLEETLDRNKKTLFIGPYYKMIQEGKKIFKENFGYYYNYYPLSEFDEEKLKTMKNLMGNHEQVIFTLSTPGSLKYLENLKEYKDKISVIVTLTPQNAKDLQWVKNIVIIYGTTNVAFNAGFLTLTGDFNPTGIVPLTNFRF